MVKVEVLGGIRVMVLFFLGLFKFFVKLDRVLGIGILGVNLVVINGLMIDVISIKIMMVFNIVFDIRRLLVVLIVWYLVIVVVNVVVIWGMERDYMVKFFI